MSGYVSLFKVSTVYLGQISLGLLVKDRSD